MNLNWSNRVIKYVLFVFNLLFVITGIIMIAVGVSVKSYYTDYDIFLNDSYFSLPNLLIAIGSLIFFISFFGCCGAIRESWFMIFIFSVLLSIIFIMELSAGIAGYVLRDQTASFLTDELKQSMKDYEFNPADNKANPTTYMWDKIQKGFQCCGTDGPKDWPKERGKTTTTAPPSTTPITNSPTATAKSSISTTKPETTISTTNVPTNTTTPTTLNTTTSTTLITDSPPPNSNSGLQGFAKLVSGMDENDLPSSCCTPKPGAAGTTTCNLNNNETSTSTYFKKGCVDGFGDYLKEHAVTIGGVGIAIAFIQLFGVIFACHLSKQLKHGFYST